MGQAFDIFFGVWIMIGIGNFASHILTCGQCKSVAANFFLLLVTGVEYVFGWPKTAYDHFKNINNPPPEKPAMKSFELAKIPGESEEEYGKRAAAIINALNGDIK